MIRRCSARSRIKSLSHQPLEPSALARGTAEQWIKEGKYAVKWTRLSCGNLRDNQARLQLFALAYNLGNFLRRLALPRSMKHWSLTTLREKLIKIGAKVVRHSGYVIFQMAEVGSTRVVRGDLGTYPALRCAAAVGAAWLTLVTEPKVGDSSAGQSLRLR